MNPYESHPPPPRQQPSVEHGREPCPDRILDDIGGAFGMGAVGGGLWHYFKGLRNSPSGQRFKGGIEAVRGNAPRLGGSFAIWGALFSSFDCTLEDPWNSIASGALTAGVINLRNGITPAAKSAAVGGVLLAMIEGLGIMISKMMSPPPPSTIASMQASMPPAGLPAESMPPPPFTGPLHSGQMATAQSQMPSEEIQTVNEETEQRSGWGSVFGWGKKTREETLDDSSFQFAK